MRNVSVILLVLFQFSLWSGKIAHAQSAALERFAGIYQSKSDEVSIKFVLTPSETGLSGTINFGGRSLPLQADLDGITMNGVFERGGDYYFFSMPFSSTDRYIATFEGEGAINFRRKQLPSFDGKFDGNHGALRLFKQSAGKYDFVYQNKDSALPVRGNGQIEGLSVKLKGLGGVYYNEGEKAYYTDVSGDIVKADFHTNASIAEAEKAAEKRRVAQKRAEEARRIEQARAELAKRQQLDKAAWSEAKSKNTKESLKGYIRKQPSGAYVVAARSALEALEDKAWSKAQKRTRYLHDYVRMWPDGKYIDQVRETKVIANWNEAKSDIASSNGNEGDFESLRKHLLEFPNSRFKQAAEKMAWAIFIEDGASMTQYLHYTSLWDTSDRDLDKVVWKWFQDRPTDANKNDVQGYLIAFPDGIGVEALKGEYFDTLVSKNWKAVKGGSAAQLDNFITNWTYEGSPLRKTAVNHFCIAMAGHPEFSLYGYSGVKNISDIQIKAAPLSLEKCGKRVEQSDAPPEVVYAFARMLSNQKKYSAAHSLWTRQALSGVGLAMNEVAHNHRKGIGTTKDIKSAVQWYEKAAKSGIKSAWVELGNIYSSGEGVRQSSRRAIRYHKKAIAAGDTSGWYAIGKMYYSGESVKKSYEKALKNFYKARGHGLAIYYISYMQENGLGTTKNFSLALTNYQVAASLDDPTAINRLGWIYYKGKGVSKNQSWALERFKAAALLGHGASAYQAGYMYLNKLGTPKKDPLEAIKWYKLGADNGHIDSANRLGYLHQGRDGVAPDSGETLKYYLRAAQLGNHHGMYAVGFLLQRGRGASKDMAKAIEWYEKAVAGKNSDAMYELGKIVMASDRSRGQRLLTNAAALGHEKAKEYLQDNFGITVSKSN